MTSFRQLSLSKVLLDWIGRWNFKLSHFLLKLNVIDTHQSIDKIGNMMETIPSSISSSFFRFMKTWTPRGDLFEKEISIFSSGMSRICSKYVIISSKCSVFLYFVYLFIGLGKISMIIDTTEYINEMHWR